MFSDIVSDGYCTALAASSRATGSEGSFEIADVASVRHRGSDASTDILGTVDAEESQENHGTALAARRCGGPFEFKRVIDPMRGVLIGWDIELCDKFYRKFEMPKLYEITLEGGGRTAEYAVR